MIFVGAAMKEFNGLDGGQARTEAKSGSCFSWSSFFLLEHSSTTKCNRPSNWKRAAGVAKRIKTCLHCRRPGFEPWVRKIAWRRAWQPTPVFLPEELQGQRTLVVYTVHGVSKN